MNTETVKKPGRGDIERSSSSDLLAIIVVYGPPMSGKTINKEALREHFACDCVVDEAEPVRIRESYGRVLVLSPTPDIRDPWYKGRKALDKMPRLQPDMSVSVDEAKNLLGARWIVPDPNFFRR